MAARRYLTVVQAAEGYPAPSEPLEPAPPAGPAAPVLHTVVLEADYEALEAVVAHIAGLSVQDDEGYSKVHVSVIEDARAALNG